MTPASAEFLARVFHRLDEERREAEAERANREPWVFAHYLGTAATAEQRRERAQRLRLAHGGKL